MSLLWLASYTFALPVRPGMWRTIKLANGKEIRAQLQGDERLHYCEDSEGQTYTRNADGTYGLADIPRLAGQVKARLAELRQKAAARKASAQKSAGEKGTAQKNAAARAIGAFGNYTGKKRCLILLAQFSDVKFAEGHDNAFYQRVANEENFTTADGFRGSVRDYFLAQSNGRFELDFDIAGPYTMPNTCAYYGENNSMNYNQDKHADEMVATACRMAHQDGVDFSRYDWEGDDNVDMVFVIYAGYGEATSSNRPNVIWPHQFELDYTNQGLDLQRICLQQRD